MIMSVVGWVEGRGRKEDGSQKQNPLEEVNESGILQIEQTTSIGLLGGGGTNSPAIAMLLQSPDLFVGVFRITSNH